MNYKNKNKIECKSMRFITLRNWKMNDIKQLNLIYENMSNVHVIGHLYSNLVKLVHSKENRWYGELMHKNFVSLRGRSNPIFITVGDNKDEALLKLDMKIKTGISGIEKIQLPFEENDINEVIEWDKGKQSVFSRDTSLFEKYNLLVINQKGSSMIKSRSNYELYFSNGMISFLINGNFSIRDLLDSDIVKSNLNHIQKNFTEALNSEPIIMDYAFFDEL